MIDIAVNILMCIAFIAAAVASIAAWRDLERSHKERNEYWAALLSRLDKDEFSAAFFDDIKWAKFWKRERG